MFRFRSFSLSRVQTENRRVKEYNQAIGPDRGGHHERETKKRKLTLSGKDLEELEEAGYLRFQLPSETEARYWLEQWREGAKPKQETRIRKIVIRRNRKEVKE